LQQQSKLEADLVAMKRLNLLPVEEQDNSFKLKNKGAWSNLIKELR